MNEQQVIAPGTYRHYKGHDYEVIAVGKHTETEEDVVIYRPLYPSDVQYWVRPYEMFCSNVIVEGVQVQRFTRVS
jgi:hypothetical protein